MRSWWRIGVTITVLIVPLARAFAVRQNDFQRECVDLQCPETAFESGVRNLIDDESLSSEKCQDCNQCTASGYSICMRTRPHRASRALDERAACSCAHSVPINCHSRVGGTRHPANISMKPYSICYLSALQAPPRPLAVSEKRSVIFTIEPFWLEPYWRELKLDNLSFHYDFIVKNPEHCEGSVVTSGDGVHFCNNVIPLNMTGDGNEEIKDDDYEHSDNYDEYDDELPEEVEIDRDIFVGAPEVQVYYFVDVHQPRQLDTKAKSGTLIRDMKTSVESEILRYDLKSDFDSVDNLPSLTDSETDDEDISEEHGGTEFFEDDQPKKNLAQNENGQKSKEKPVTNTNTVTNQNGKNEDKDETYDELTTPVTTTLVEEEVTVDYSKEGEEGDEEEGDESTISENDAEKSTEPTEVDSNDGAQTYVEDDKYLTIQEDDHNTKNLTLVQRIIKNKGLLARWIFGGTIAVCLVFILCVLIFRRRCCKSRGSSKSVSGNRYNTINGQSVESPEKEALNH